MSTEERASASMRVGEKEASGELVRDASIVPPWLSEIGTKGSAPTEAETEALLHEVYSEIARLRAKGAEDILARGIRVFKDNGLRDRYRLLLALAMHTGEDCKNLIEVGKELAKIEGWYKATKIRVGKKNEGAEGAFIRALEERRKNA